MKVGVSEVALNCSRNTNQLGYFETVSVRFGFKP